MVPNLSKGAGIKGTALYVLHDERTLEDRALGADLMPDQQTAGRVGFTATRNLSTDDPELAWRLMAATAKNHEALKRATGQSMAGRKTEKFCGHLSLSWEHQTQPDKAEMLRAVDGALKALGWENQQSLIVQHKDHDHAHVHIVVNLIDAATGKAAPNSRNDYDKLQAWAHEYDKARGLNVCTERTKKLEAKERGEPAPKADRAMTRDEWEGQKAAANDDRPQTRQAKADAYRAAVAAVREEFRPEWGQHYKQARTDAVKLAKEQRALSAELERCKSPKARAAFYNRHREAVWRGLEGQKIGNTHTLISAGKLREAIERNHEKERAALDAATATRKADILARTDTARQEAQRAIFRSSPQRQQRPAEKPAPEKAQDRGETAPKSQAERELEAFGQRRQHAAVGRHSPAQRAAQAQQRAQEPKKATPETPTPSPANEQSEAALRRYAEARDRRGDRADEKTRAGSSAGKMAPGDPAPVDELAKQREAIRARMNASRELRARDRNRDRDRER